MIIDFVAHREKRVDLIQRLRGRGMSVAEVALLARCSPRMVERIAPAYESTSEALIEKWTRRHLRRQARRDAQHRPLKWICMANLSATGSGQ